MDSTSLEKYNCPICLQLPKAEVFQCINGHSLCSNCQTRVSTCPLCRASLEQLRIRNRALEEVLDSLRFDCKYKSRGCSSKLSRYDRVDHERNCFYSGTVLNFCELLGYICNYRMSTKEIGAASQHFKEAHHFRVSESTLFNLHFPFLVPINSESWGYSWEPLMIETPTSPDFKAYDENNHSINNFVQLGLTIKSNNPTVDLDIKFGAPPCHIKHCPQVLRFPTVNFPIEQLKSDYLQNDLLVINCSINCDNRRCLRPQSTSLFSIDPVETIVLTVNERVLPHAENSDISDEGNTRTANVSEANTPWSGVESLKSTDDVNFTGTRKRTKLRATTSSNDVLASEGQQPPASSISNTDNNSNDVGNTMMYIAMINVLFLLFAAALYYLMINYTEKEHLDTFPWNILKKLGYKVKYEP